MDGVKMRAKPGPDYRVRKIARRKRPQRTNLAPRLASHGWCCLICQRAVDHQRRLRMILRLFRHPNGGNGAMSVRVSERQPDSTEPFMAAPQGPRANGESQRGASYVFRGVVCVVLRLETIREGAGAVVLAEGKARGKRQKRHVRVTHTHCIESHQIDSPASRE